MTPTRYQRLREARHAAGQCWYCPRPITPGSSGCCARHVLYKREHTRAREGTQPWQPGRVGRPPMALPEPRS